MTTGIRCTCGTGHQTYGACMRAKNIRVGQIDRDAQKAWDSEIKAFRSARAQGVLPQTSQMKDIRQAMEISEATGKAFDSSRLGGPHA